MIKTAKRSTVLFKNNAHPKLSVVKKHPHEINVRVALRELMVTPGFWTLFECNSIQSRTLRHALVLLRDRSPQN